MWNPFKKKSQTIGDAKRELAGGQWSMLGNCNTFVSPELAYQMYMDIAPIKDSVRKIKKHVANIPIQIIENGEVQEDSYIIDFLSNPSQFICRSVIFEEITRSLELTNEFNIIFNGNVEKEPNSYKVVRPQHVAVSSSLEEIPSFYRITENGRTETFYKTIVRGYVRYFNKAKDKEFFSVVKESLNHRGESPLSALVEESNHILKGGKHNTSMLNNGMKPTASFSPKDNSIEKEDWEGLKSAIEMYHMGYSNAGKPFVSPVPLSVLSVATTNRDMDFANLIQIDESRVYTMFDIPLPLVKSQNMTQSNYEVAIPALYTEAVIPAFNFIAENLTRILKLRFTNFKGHITYNKFGIPALERSNIEIMKIMGETRYTTNEIRTRGGEQPLPEDIADKVLIPANLVELGQEDFK